MTTRLILLQEFLFDITYTSYRRYSYRIDEELMKSDREVIDEK